MYVNLCQTLKNVDENGFPSFLLKLSKVLLQILFKISNFVATDLWLKPSSCDKVYERLTEGCGSDQSLRSELIFCYNFSFSFTVSQTCCESVPRLDVCSMMCHELIDCLVKAAWPPCYTAFLLKSLILCRLCSEEGDICY